MTEQTSFSALIVDMATLTIQHSKTTGVTQVRMADGYQLAALTITPDTSDSDVLYLAFKHAMEHARIYSLDVLNPGEPIVRHIALYNPLTSEIELVTPQGSHVFRNPTPLQLPPEGLPASVNLSDGGTADLALLTGATTTVLAASERTFSEITRALASV